MKIATAEFPDETARYPAAIDAIAAHIRENQPDLLVLAEMPFTPWVFHTDRFDQRVWDQTVAGHAEWLDRFHRAVRAPLITSRPTNIGGRRLNQAIFVDGTGAVRPLRSKYYLPNEFPAVEAPWFDIGDPPGEVFDLLGHRMGVQLCSELMFAEIPRMFGLNGAQIVVQPRATGSHPRWRATAVLSAATSGAFVIGANRRSVERDWFTGGSWVYGPGGDLIAETSAASPIVTVAIDRIQADMAKNQYPLPMFNDYRGRP